MLAVELARFAVAIALTCVRRPALPMAHPQLLRASSPLQDETADTTTNAACASPSRSRCAGAWRRATPEEFTAGTGPRVPELVPIGVSTCREVVHPDPACIGPHGAEPCSVANDGWPDGDQPLAGRQHLAMAVFRAVESRRFLVRAATTGNSAVIDPYGRILTSQSPDTAGVITAQVSGSRMLTPYVRAGDLFAVACVLIGLSAMPWPARIRRRRRPIVPVPAI
jgi:apolipoprotein N-acyltransferase